MAPHPISEKVHSTFLAFPKNLIILPIGGCCLQQVLEGRASLGREQLLHNVSHLRPKPSPHK